jgi:hypothetical protein
MRMYEYQERALVEQAERALQLSRHHHPITIGVLYRGWMQVRGRVNHKGYGTKKK